MCQQKLNSGANFDGTADLIKKLEDDIKEVNKFTRTKMDFNEASRNETKMRVKTYAIEIIFKSLEPFQSYQLTGPTNSAGKVMI